MEWLRSWIIAVALLALMVFGLVRANDQRSVLAWPTVSGRITSLDFKSTLVQVGKNKGGGVFYVPVVAYRYWVHGKPQTGHRLTPYETDEVPTLDSRSVPELSMKLGRTVAVGTEVAVHYNPSDYSDSYAWVSSSGFPIFLALFPAVPFVIALMSARRRESQRAQGFWKGFLRATKDHPRLWTGLRAFLFLYPALAVLVYGLGTADVRRGPALFTLIAHYAAVLILPVYARLVGETLPGEPPGVVL